MAKKKPLGSLASDLREVKSIVDNEKYLKEAGQVLWQIARRNASNIPFKYATGELPQSIQMAITRSPRQMTAHVGTNLEYAAYIEFGTGQKGAANHNGTSPEVQVAYRTSPWWIHRSMVNPAAAEVYGWFKNSDYQRVTGQPAHPYLYPALKNNEQLIANTLVGGWENAIRKATK